MADVADGISAKDAEGDGEEKGGGDADMAEDVAVMRMRS